MIKYIFTSGLILPKLLKLLSLISFKLYSKIVRFLLTSSWKYDIK